MKGVVCFAVGFSGLVNGVTLTNGSFENLDSSYVNDSGTDQDNGAMAPGWTTIESPDWFWGEGPEGLWETPFGDHFALGAAEDAFYREGVWQDVSGFTVGASYELTFYQANGLYFFGGGYVGVNIVGGWELLIDGVSIDFFDSDNPNNVPAPDHTTDWLERTVEFVATSETMEVRFLAFKNPQVMVQGPTFQFLDAISITPIPEPGVLGLLVFAGGYGFLRRRSR